MRYVFAKHEIVYWKHVLHWNRKEMKNENPGILWIVISFACTENEKFQIYKFTVFTIFFSSKAWNLIKTLRILFFVLYDITYIQNTGNGNNYLNLPINKNIMRYFFWRVYILFKIKSTLLAFDWKLSDHDGLYQKRKSRPLIISESKLFVFIA